MAVHSGCCARPPRPYWLKHHLLMHHAGRPVRHWLDTKGETDGPAEPLEPRRGRNSRTTNTRLRAPPSSPHSPSPRPGVFAACVSAGSACSFFFLVSEGVAAVTSSS